VRGFATSYEAKLGKLTQPFHPFPLHLASPIPPTLGITHSPLHLASPIPPYTWQLIRNAKFGLDLQQLASRRRCYCKAVSNSAYWHKALYNISIDYALPLYNAYNNFSTLTLPEESCTIYGRPLGCQNVRYATPCPYQSQTNIYLIQHSTDLSTWVTPITQKYQQTATNTNKY